MIDCNYLHSRFRGPADNFRTDPYKAVGGAEKRDA